MKQFQYLEFVRTLQKLTQISEERFRCRYSTKQLIRRILETDYPYRDDDLEYLLDMVNYRMRLLDYNSKKKYFRIGKALDTIVEDSVFYIEEYNEDNQNRLIS